jgi:CRISPR-associated protein Cmr6
MAIAAVPNYLGSDFSQASPGLRFAMYTRLWTAAWKLDNDGKRDSLKDVVQLSGTDVKAMHAIVDRQAAFAMPGVDSGWIAAFDARSIAPFTTGLGNEHPLGNGFAFLKPHGLPYFPGSGVKGAIHAAAEELESGAWGATGGWTKDAIDFLFGVTTDKEGGGNRGALSFWDAFARLPGDRLHVEVMTPHQSHYLQGRDSPHDSGTLNPITFLTIPPDARFSFHVSCDLPFLARRARHLAENDEWKRLLEAAFEHAFAWLGFGAKTAVGYGAMERDETAAQERDLTRRIAAEEERRRQMTPQRAQVEQFISNMRMYEKDSQGRKEQPYGRLHQAASGLAKQALAEDGGWSAEDRCAAGEAIREWLPRVVRITNTNDAFNRLRLSMLLGGG